MMKKTILSILCMAAITAYAQVYTTDNGYAKFDASTSMSSYSGETNSLAGSINLETRAIEFKVPVDSIKTGNGARDKDMYELLKTDEYPYITFEGVLTTDFDPEGDRQKAVAKGNFTIRDHSRDITVEGTLEKTGQGLELLASWTLMITDYNIERPSIFFVKVKDVHELSINALLKEE
jgi:polyisoprenoid-binding protein YceI